MKTGLFGSDSVVKKKNRSQICGMHIELVRLESEVKQTLKAVFWMKKEQIRLELDYTNCLFHFI